MKLVDSALHTTIDLMAATLSANCKRNCIKALASTRARPLKHAFSASTRSAKERFQAAVSYSRVLVALAAVSERDNGADNRVRRLSVTPPIRMAPQVTLNVVVCESVRCLLSQVSWSYTGREDRFESSRGKTDRSLDLR